MAKAIGIRVTAAEGDYDLAASKFFGSPTVPEEWADDFDEDILFLCQFRLADLAALDTEDRLPHTGYLYIFLDTAEGAYQLHPIVRYYDGEPDTVLGDFNEIVADYERFTQAWLMNFEAVDEDEVCTRLFGAPSDWNYEDEPPRLLRQYDPLDAVMGFLDHLDGFLYFFAGNTYRDFGNVTLHEEYS